MARAVATAVFACASGYVGEGQHGGAVLVENGFVTLRNCRAYNNVATLKDGRPTQVHFLPKRNAFGGQDFTSLNSQFRQALNYCNYVYPNGNGAIIIDLFIECGA